MITSLAAIAVVSVSAIAPVIAKANPVVSLNPCGKSHALWLDGDKANV